MPKKKTAKKQRKTNDPYPVPLPFRYDRRDDAPSTMRLEQDDLGAIFSVPFELTLKDELPKPNPQIAVLNSRTYKQLPNYSDRVIQQGKVMGVSANDAAEALGIPGGDIPKWEWLHLIAFSLKPTHVQELSGISRKLIRKTKRVQQIRENLVLGTAASNTEMLSWEDAIKKVMKKFPNVELNIWVYSDVEKERVELDDETEVDVPYCTKITYHVNFSNSQAKTLSQPLLIQFDPLSHNKPGMHTYENVYKAVEGVVKNMIVVPNLPFGIRTQNLIKL